MFSEQKESGSGKKENAHLAHMGGAVWSETAVMKEQSWKVAKSGGLIMLGRRRRTPINGLNLRSEMRKRVKVSP